MYLGKDNLNRAFNVIRGMFRSKKGNKNLSQHNADFNRIYEKLKMLFPISQDMKKMQKQWDQLTVLTFLGNLPSEYTFTRSQIIGSSAIDSLQETSISSRCLSG